MMKLMFPFFLMMIIFYNQFWMFMLMLINMFFFFYLLFCNYFEYVSLMMIKLDYLSFNLICLSFWIVFLMYIASFKIYLLKIYKLEFNMIVFFLLMFLYFTFLTSNMFLFYVMFESSLIPTLILIMGWGYQPERLHAGLYMLFYTLFASLPLLISMLYYFNIFLNLSMLTIYNFYSLNFFYLSILIAFLVKLPMFIVHLWLPKAHVEAPISGSMILAAVLLKLGGYGMMRVLIMLMKLNKIYNLWFISLGMIGALLTSMNCLLQIDMKMLIAYSSVVHMGLIIGGLLTMYYWGFIGSLEIMIGHGLCSSGLFCLANISYERIHSRMLLMNKGMMNFMPTMCMWWFLLCSSNMSAPPSLNLLAEISLINCLIVFSVMMMLVIFFFSFFSAAYCLYIYSYSQHGVLYSSMYCSSNGVMREIILLFSHWFPLNYLILIGMIFII